MASIHIREIGSDAIIHSVEIRTLSKTYVDKVHAGLFQRVDLERYWIDRKEVDKAIKSANKGKATK